MNQSKHTNLGLGILIGGLGMALFFRQSPDENDFLPELEQAKVLERDFSLDFDEPPILPDEIDQFEALHPLEFGDTKISDSGARIQGIEVASTPERERPIPELLPERKTQIRTQSIEDVATIAESTPRSDEAREVFDSETNLATAGTTVPAKTVNSKAPGPSGFVLPDNMFTESFLKDRPVQRENSVDLQSKNTSPSSGQTTAPNDGRGSEQSSTESVHPVEQLAKPPARVIIPRRIQLNAPVASQLGVSTYSPQPKVRTRSIEVNSTAAELPEIDGQQRFSSSARFQDKPLFGETRDREFFPSLDGLEPLSNSGEKD